MEELIHFDQQLLLSINGSDSLFVDYLVATLTNAKTWIALYIALFYVVLKSNDTALRVLLVLVGAGLCVLFAGGVDDTIVKPLVARWRPGNDPEIGMLVDTVDGYRGGKYGFFSAHAANTFSLALYLSMLMRCRRLTVALVIWSLVNCWTRMYLGVHYPGDITVGLLWGALVGYGVYRLYCRLSRPAVYNAALCDIPIAVLVFTFIYALIRAAILSHLLF
jgi:undecaprenyl-diphosphatase